VSNKSPAFQWYPKDILASARVQEMSLAEEGAYRRLLDYCWLNGSVPRDEKRCARLIGKGCTPETAKYVLEMFTVDPNDESRMIHDRLEIEREKQESNSKARQAAAEARWNKQGTSVNGNGKQVKSDPDANALQTDMQNNALHISSSNFNTNTHINANDFSFAIQQLIEAFPDIQLQPTQIGMIESEVKEVDKLAWTATINTYRANYNPSKNQYLPEKVGNLLGVFRKEKAELEKKQNGINKNGNGHQTVKPVNSRTNEETLASLGIT
jgi:uncharacterized protein YdaU (DUF1376 family)